MDTFGQRLVFAREQCNISQKELAEKLGITPTRLNYWEKDKREPAIDMIKSLAQILGVGTDFLIGLSKPAPKVEKFPDTTEVAPGNELEREIIRLAGNLSDEQKDFFLALLRLIAARNQGLSAAELVSVGEATIKAGHHSSTQ